MYKNAINLWCILFHIYLSVLIIYLYIMWWNKSFVFLEIANTSLYLQKFFAVNSLDQ